MNASIRQWLLVWQISALIAISLIIMLTTYHLAWDGFNRMRDYSLEQIAHAVLRHTGDAPRPMVNVPVEADKFVSQVWNADGVMVFASRPDAVLPRQPVGLTTLMHEGEDWHVMVLEDHGTVVQIATTTASRYRMFNTLGPWLLLPFAALIFVLGGLILHAVNRALAPLYQLRDEVALRSPERLEAFTGKDYPSELGPLVDALNALLQRLQMAFASQQRFIADAAHELRSPLTAVRLQAQILTREEDAEARQAAQMLMQLGVDRASHLVNQLLSLARFERQFRAVRTHAPVDLLAVVKTVIIEKTAQSEVDLGLLDSDALSVMGDQEALRVMIGNLLDNAIRYAGHAGAVDVRILRQGDAALIHITDHGPGIPADARSRVLEPFCRLAGQEIPGSGLGLAIVAEIVAMHAGSLRLGDTAGGGLTVEISLPAILN